MMILEIAKRALIPWLVDSSGNVLTATAVSATCGQEMFGKCLKSLPSKHPFLHLDKTKHDDFWTNVFFFSYFLHGMWTKKQNWRQKIQLKRTCNWLNNDQSKQEDVSKRPIIPSFLKDDQSKQKVVSSIPPCVLAIMIDHCIHRKNQVNLKIMFPEENARKKHHPHPKKIPPPPQKKK